MAVAQQMISGFQQAMVGVMPGQGTLAVPPQPTKVYFALINDLQVGPLSSHDLIRMVRERELHASTLLWSPGIPKWMPATAFAEVMAIVAAAPPAQV